MDKTSKIEEDLVNLFFYLDTKANTAGSIEAIDIKIINDRINTLTEDLKFLRETDVLHDWMKDD